MSESVGMQIINQRTEDITRAMGVHELTVFDLKRLQARFLTMAALVDEAIGEIQKDLERGDGGL